jgi:1,4-alpha-glucan branching enzyme
LFFCENILKKIAKGKGNFKETDICVFKEEVFMTKKNSSKTINRRKVLFVFESPQSQNVSLVGNFNDWDEKKHPMKNDGNGVWTKTVMLMVGIHEYKFVVDQKWVQDPTNPRLVTNSFGTLNNIIEVE